MEFNRRPHRLDEPLLREIPAGRAEADGLASSKPDGRGRRPRAGNLSERAYEVLYGEIVTGTVPSGTVLSEAAIAKRLGVSRTPVGEAVRQLVRDGLVSQVPRVGTVVRHLSRSQLIANYELREALESYGAAMAAQRASREDIALIARWARMMDEMAATFDSTRAEPLDVPSLRQFLSADLAFHLAVISAARSPMIADAISSSHGLAQMFASRRHLHDAAVVRRASNFHSRIATAIASGDAAGASSVMLEHIQLGKRQSIEDYDREASSTRDGAFVLLPEVKDQLRGLEEEFASLVARPAVANDGA